MSKYISNKKIISDFLKGLFSNLTEGKEIDYNLLVINLSLDYGVTKKVIMDLVDDYEDLGLIEIRKFSPENIVIKKYVAKDPIKEEIKKELEEFDNLIGSNIDKK